MVILGPRLSAHPRSSRTLVLDIMKAEAQAWFREPSMGVLTFRLDLLRT